MDERSYLVPANTKKSLLILSVLRPFPDTIILGVGIAITVIALMIIGNNTSIGITLLACIPMIISLALVLPIPNYHNTLVALQSVINFYKGRRNYIWN